MTRQPRPAHRPEIDVDLGLGRNWGYDDRIWAYHTGFTRGGGVDVVGSPSPSPSPSLSHRHARIGAVCHPGRRAEARGMCQSCYVQWRRWIRREGLVMHPPKRLRELGIGRNGRDPNERLLHP